MLPEIKKLLEFTPFRPFSLRTADGREYLVSTVDHIYMVPGSKDVIVADDEGTTVRIPTFYVTGLVEVLSPAPTGEAPSKL